MEEDGGRGEGEGEGRRGREEGHEVSEENMDKTKTSSSKIQSRPKHVRNMFSFVDGNIVWPHSLPYQKTETQQSR